MKDNNIMKKIEKEILVKYKLEGIKNKLKKENNQKKLILSKLMELEKKIFDFMYSKLDDSDKEYVQKLIDSKQKIIND